MRWAIKKYIFNFRKMLIIETDLRTYASAFLDRRTIRGNPVVISRLESIDSNYETKLEKAFGNLDIKSYFDIGDCSNRIRRGFYFHVAEAGDEIVGWAWSATGRVYFEEFFSDIAIPDGTAFSYNFYIDKRFRGTGLPFLLIDLVLSDLRDDGKHLFWGLCYPHNKNVMAFNKLARGKIAGQYYFIRLLMWSFSVKRYFKIGAL